MDVPNPREVSDLAQRIMRTESELATLKETWEALFTPRKEPRKPAGRPVRENSVASQVLAAINDNPASEWDAETLSQSLLADRDTVASALYNLYVAKKIARKARGQYQALEKDVFDHLAEAEEPSE